MRDSIEGKITEEILQSTEMSFMARLQLIKEGSKVEISHGALAHV